MSFLPSASLWWDRVCHPAPYLHLTGGSICLGFHSLAHRLWPPVTLGGSWFVLRHASTALPRFGCVWAAIMLTLARTLCRQRRRQTGLLMSSLSVSVRFSADGNVGTYDLPEASCPHRDSAVYHDYAELQSFQSDFSYDNLWEAEEKELDTPHISPAPGQQFYQA